MDAAVAAWDAFYARADGVIKPAVFSTLDRLGWHLTPSASRALLAPSPALQPDALLAAPQRP